MKIALISDIHANLEALQAVMAHIDEQGDVDQVYCLGDVVGYGPDPAGVIDIIRERCEFCLLGNHDYALLNTPEGFNFVAAGAIQCQRRELDPDGEESESGIYTVPEKRDRWEYLKDLPEKMVANDDLFVHASPRSPIFEYLLPEDTLVRKDKIDDCFKRITRNCYVGHTHQPGVITEEPRFYTPKDIGNEYAFYPGEKLLLNVSSVGQPRDRDPRACYATVTDSGVRWHRVEYDVEETVRKVKENPCLDDRCGLRLLEGR